MDDKLNFNLHISNICRSAANQLNALIRLKCYLSFNAKRVLINSYIISNFNYYPLVWIFSTAKSLNKIESLQKRALQFLYNDYSISYEGLLEEAGKVKMNAYRLRNLCVEIYKAINKLNPEFMNNIFKVKENKRKVHKFTFTANPFINLKHISDVSSELHSLSSFHLYNIIHKNSYFCQGGYRDKLQ